MKYFTKISFWDRSPAPIPTPEVKPYKTYGQIVQGLPTHALKKRLSKLNSQLALLDNSDLTDAATTNRKSISGKMEGIMSELKNRNDF